MARDWGANREKNQRLARSTGYQGDFGDGQFSNWYTNKASRDQKLDTKRTLRQTSNPSRRSSAERQPAMSTGGGGGNTGGRDWGDNVEKNQGLAQTVGYDGDFGGGQFNTWLGNQDEGTQSLATAYLNTGGNEGRWGGYGFPENPTSRDATSQNIHGGRTQPLPGEDSVPFENRGPNYDWSKFWRRPGELRTGSDPTDNVFSVEFEDGYDWQDPNAALVPHYERFGGREAWEQAYGQAAPKVGWNAPGSGGWSAPDGGSNGGSNGGSSGGGRDWGDNVDRNKQLAEETGYTGDFGDKGFRDWWFREATPEQRDAVAPIMQENQDLGNQPDRNRQIAQATADFGDFGDGGFTQFYQNASPEKADNIDDWSRMYDVERDYGNKPFYNQYLAGVYEDFTGDFGGGGFSDFYADQNAAGQANLDGTAADWNRGGINAAGNRTDNAASLASVFGQYSTYTPEMQHAVENNNRFRVRYA